MPLDDNAIDENHVIPNVANIAVMTVPVTA